MTMAFKDIARAPESKWPMGTLYQGYWRVSAVASSDAENLRRV